MVQELFANPDFLVSGWRYAHLETAVKKVFEPSPAGAMVFGGDLDQQIQQWTKAKPLAGFNFFRFPSINGSSGAMVMGVADAVTLTKSSPATHASAVHALLEYLATPEAATLWARRGNFESPNRGVTLSAYRDPILRQEVVDLKRANVFKYGLFGSNPLLFQYASALWVP
jgi:alpha-glucoside transport system substrate-binding protein